MMYDVLASYYDALVEDAQARDAWIELIEANIRGRSFAWKNWMSPEEF